MGKFDKNGVRHDGWEAVYEANQNRRGYSGSHDCEYENKAKEQGVDLSKTSYRKTSGYSFSRVK